MAPDLDVFEAFFEQVLRPGFAFRYREGGLLEKKLKGHTAHIIVTMGMPTLLIGYSTAPTASKH